MPDPSRIFYLNLSKASADLVSAEALIRKALKLLQQPPKEVIIVESECPLRVTRKGEPS